MRITARFHGIKGLSAILFHRCQKQKTGVNTVQWSFGERATLTSRLWERRAICSATDRASVSPDPCAEPV